jgi:P-type conjugative transfer ATPase TrbB
MLNLTESQHRLYGKLYRDLGNEIISALGKDDVYEIMLNPDGTLWQDSATQGLTQLGNLNKLQTFSIISSVAGIYGFVISQLHPYLEAELPFYQEMQGERFTAQIPPIVSAPSFCIRKKSKKIFTLDNYLESNRLTEAHVANLRKLIYDRKNILICGGPGSGKTTFTNALIKEAINYEKNQRFLILEDLPELQCAAPNKVSLLTSNNVSMNTLLRMAMRMRPDRILIGEVRGAEALDMLKAWNTGCPGGISTVHANGAIEAIQRIIDLSMEAGLSIPPIYLISHTIDAIISISRIGKKTGVLKEILALGEYRNGQFSFEKLA